jgi:Phenazine biosynthesis-like protein
MSWPDVTVVDACVRRYGRRGSPTAITDDDPATTDMDRVAVAAAAGTSRAAFLGPGRTSDGGWPVRFFTATAEPSGCGHGTVAAQAVRLTRTALGEPNDRQHTGRRTFNTVAIRRPGWHRRVTRPGPRRAASPGTGRARRDRRRARAHRGQPAACGYETICESCDFFTTGHTVRPTLQAQHDDAAAKAQPSRQQLFAQLFGRPNEDVSWPGTASPTNDQLDGDHPHNADVSREAGARPP